VKQVLKKQEELFDLQQMIEFEQRLDCLNFESSHNLRVAREEQADLRLLATKPSQKITGFGDTGADHPFNAPSQREPQWSMRGPNLINLSELVPEKPSHFLSSNVKVEKFLHL